MKYLIETSAVPAALGSSSLGHNQHFAEQVEGGDLYSSSYIRMEFIRRWFCDGVRVALTIDQCTTVSHAIKVLEQDFSPRNIKGVLAVIAETLKRRGSIDDTRETAVEIASDAIAQLKKFDKLFPARIANICKCQIGSHTPKIDYNHLMDDLRGFYYEFRTPVKDCEVNNFLKLRNAHSGARKILDDAKAGKLTAALALKDFKDRSKWITCTECRKIGDVIIALEQPSSWCMVHLDTSFDEPCRVLDRQHKPMKSVSAIEKEARMA